MTRALTRSFPVALAFLAVGGAAPMARAELPPWVYGQQQRQAPVVLRLQVLQAERKANEALVRGQVVKVWRQPRTLSLQPGQTIELRYGLPPERGPGMVGPSPLPLPRVGESLTAWLQPAPGAGPGPMLAPAAGGRSFGPSMETFREP
jgi:hypothetical protein